MTSEQEDQGMLMTGDATVERGEDFQQVEEHVDAHGIGDDGRQGLDGVAAGIEAGEAAHDEDQQQQDGGTGAERRGQEAGGHDGGQPVMAAGDAGVQEGGHGVDGEGPQDREVDQGLDPLGRFHVMALGFQGDPADDGVEGQVADEHDHVIEHDRIGRGMQQHVHHALGLAQVHHDEEGAHDHGRDGHEFTEDDHALELLVVVEVGGQHQHDGGSGHTHKIGELRDVEAPRDIAAHAGDGEAFLQLLQVDQAATGDDCEQEEQPQVVGLGTGKQFFKHGLFSLDEVVNAGLGAQIGLAANAVVGGEGLAHIGLGIVEIAEEDAAAGSFHAGGHLAHGQATPIMRVG